MILYHIKYYKLSSECRSQAPSQVHSSDSLCSQGKFLTGCRTLGQRRLCLVPVSSTPGKSHSQGCDVLGAMSHWPLAFLYHAGNISMMLIWSQALLSAKYNQSKSSLPRQTCLSPRETSNPVSPSANSLFHVLVNPNRFGHIYLCTGKDERCDLKEFQNIES